MQRARTFIGAPRADFIAARLWVARFRPHTRTQRMPRGHAHRRGRQVPYLVRARASRLFAPKAAAAAATAAQN